MVTEVQGWTKEVLTDIAIVAVLFTTGDDFDPFYWKFCCETICRFALLWASAWTRKSQNVSAPHPWFLYFATFLLRKFWGFICSSLSASSIHGRSYGVQEFIPLCRGVLQYKVLKNIARNWSTRIPQRCLGMAKVCAAMLDKKKSSRIGTSDKKNRTERDGRKKIIQGTYKIKNDRNARSEPQNW